MGNKWRQEGCLSCWEASLWNCLGVVRSQVGGLDRGLLNLSLLTLGGGTLSSLPPNYGCVGRCWWWCHILLRFSLKKKKIKPTTNQTKTFYFPNLSSEERFKGCSVPWALMLLLSFGRGFGGFGGGRWEKAKQRVLPCYSLPATVVSDVPASSQTVPECLCTEAKWTCFLKITPLISPSLGPCLVRGNDYEACHLRLSWWSKGETTHGFSAALLIEQRFQKQRIFKNNEKKKEWKKDPLENPYYFPPSPHSNSWFISVAQQCGDSPALPHTHTLIWA